MSLLAGYTAFKNIGAVRRMWLIGKEDSNGRASGFSSMIIILNEGGSDHSEPRQLHGLAELKSLLHYAGSSLPLIHINGRFALV